MFVIVPTYIMGLAMIAAIIVGIVSVLINKEPAEVVSYVVVAAIVGAILYFPINWGVQKYQYWKPLASPTLAYTFKVDIDNDSRTLEPFDPKLRGIKMGEDEMERLESENSYWREYFAFASKVRGKPVPSEVVARTKAWLKADHIRQFNAEVLDLRESCSVDRRAYEEYYYNTPNIRLCDFVQNYEWPR